MKFEGIRDSLQTLFGDSADGRYRVIGYQKTSEDADKMIDNNRIIETYYSSGDFPKSGGTEAGGPINHDITFTVVLTVTQPAKGDLATLTNENATPAQLITALSGYKDACFLADRNMDEFLSIVWNILMDSRNRDLGYTENLGSRWVGNFQKGEPIDMQKLVTLSAVITLTCLTAEIPSGDPGLPGDTILIDMDINDDPVQSTGQVFDISGN